MSENKYRATQRIAETFEERRVSFEVREKQGIEVVSAGFSVEGGPSAEVWFISKDNDNDVAVRVIRLISSVPESRRERVRAVCNQINETVRYLKFYLGRDGHVNVEYDFPVSTSDESVGEMAFEILILTMKILNDQYRFLMKAIYSDEPLEEESIEERVERLRRILEERRKAKSGLREDEDILGIADVIAEDTEEEEEEEPEAWIDLSDSSEDDAL